MTTLKGSAIELNDTVIYGKPYLESASIFGKTTETGSGTKSPDNPYVLSGATKVTVSDGTIPHDYALPQKLYSLPNGVCDIFDMVAGTGTQNIKKLVLNGTESWGAAGEGDTTSGISFYCTISGTKSAITSTIQHSCDKFPVITYLASKATPKPLTFITAQTNVIIINIERSKLATQDSAGFKTWLAANPVTVLYQLAAPQTITGPGQTIRINAKYTKITNDVQAEMEIGFVAISEIPGIYNMLPPSSLKSVETAELQNALNTQVEKLLDAKDDILLQLNVETATWGLDLWEKALALTTDISKPYAFRRSRIESKLRSQGITTKIMVKNVAESFSNGIVEIIEHQAQYSFDVKFIGTLGIPPNMEDLTAAIEEIKPAHLAYAYIYTFITWDKVEAYNHTWDEWEAKNLTWDDFETHKEGT